MRSRGYPFDWGEDRSSQDGGSNEQELDEYGQGEDDLHPFSGIENPWTEDPFATPLPVRVEVGMTDYNYHFEFDSFEQFVRQAEAMPKSAMGNTSREEGRDDRWDFKLGFDGAIHLGHRGWAEGARKIEARLAVLDVVKHRAEPELAYSMVGPGVLDLQRYQQGHPAPWMTWHEGDISRESIGGVVTVLVNAAASFAMSAQEYMDKGMLVCALIDLLERHDRRVELILGLGTDNIVSSITTRVLLKRPGDALNLDRIAFAVAHPACFRRLGFAVWEHAPDEFRKRLNITTSGSYGRPHTMREDNAIVISASDYRVTPTIEGQRLWLKEQLASQGIEWEA